MSWRYFAYGATMDAEHLQAWCQENGQPLPTLADATPAVLDDHELALTVPSRAWLGAIGTIEPRTGSCVYWVLFDIPDEEADVIRLKEGVGTGLVHEVPVEVRLHVPDVEEATIQLLQASTFRAAPGRAVGSGSQVPSQRWLEHTVRGAEAYGLPDLWIAELKRRGRR